ncbi:pectate lyase [Burkholderia aenigmatica]|uniref:pectate lyase n=1 Tax=Burkholderia aenigmatica TaxID=2015348 RepID=UPI00265570E2|nr:pectate lyase [Burkholderia aenigmatica]MDN7881247.1 pectate lyase [Burkholderia aenigmatica]
MKRIVAGFAALLVSLVALGQTYQVQNLQVNGTATIPAGAINGTSIGGVTPSTGAFTSLSATTANPSLAYNFGGTGQIARQLQAYLQDSPISILDFGADPTGTFSSAGAVQAAFNYACASPWQKIVAAPPGVFLINATLTINCNGVKLVGAGGGGVNDNTPNITASTVFRWTGTSGGTALVIAPTGNEQLYDNGVLGIFWDGNNALGGIAVDMFSEKYGEFDIRAAHWSKTFVQLDISSNVTDNADTTGNMFYRIAGYQSGASDGSFLITNSTSAHNACWNTFELIQGNWNASPMIVLNGDDNENFVTVNGYNPNVNTTVKGVVLNGGATFLQSTRHLTFYHLSTTANGGAGVFAQGTNQATYPVVGINIVYYDSDNNQADPVVGPGAQLWLGRNGTPTGTQAFYWASNPTGYVQIDASGKITITGVVAVANGATSGSYTFPTFPGKSVAGFPTEVAAVNTTASTAPVIFASFASQTAITVTLSSAATQTLYFYFKVEGY